MATIHTLRRAKQQFASDRKYPVSSGINRASALAEISTNGSFGITSLNEDYYSLYEVPAYFTPVDLREVVEERASRGWYGLAEILGEEAAPDIRLAQIRSLPSFTTVEISSHGEILSSAHTSSGDGSRIRVVSALTGYSINCSRETEGGWQALLLLREMFALGQTVPRLFSDISQVSFDREGFSFLADSAGRLIIQSDAAGAPPHLIDARSMDDLNISSEALRHRLAEDDSCTFHINDPVLGFARFKARKHSLFPRGPYFLICSLLPLSTAVLPQDVQSVYRDFSPQEATAIAALAEGRTIKQAAGFLDKSPVTVALQARSALNKTPYATLEQLLPIVVVTCTNIEHRSNRSISSE